MVIYNTLAQDIYVHKPITCTDTDVTLHLIPTNRKYGNYDNREVQLKSQTDDYWIFDGEKEFQRNDYDGYVNCEFKYMAVLDDDVLTEGVLRLKKSHNANYQRTVMNNHIEYTVYKYPRTEHY